MVGYSKKLTQIYVGFFSHISQYFPGNTCITTLFWWQEKTRIPPIWPPCWDKDGAGSGISDLNLWYNHPHNNVFQNCLSVSDTTKNKSHILLLSAQDGRADIVRAAQGCCQQVYDQLSKSSNVDVPLLDSLIQGNHTCHSYILFSDWLRVCHMIKTKVTILQKLLQSCN